MAAHMMEHNNLSSYELSHLQRTDSANSESPSEDGHFTDGVAALVQKEIGGDLKSLKKVSGLLENLTLENKQLEEQVNKATDSLTTPVVNVILSMYYDWLKMWDKLHRLLDYFFSLLVFLLFVTAWNYFYKSDLAYAESILNASELSTLMI